MAKAGAGRGSSSLDLCRPDWCQSSGNRIRKEHERGPVHGRVRVELAEGRSGRGNGGRVCLESLPLAGGGRSLWSGRGRGAGDHGCGRCAPGPGRSPHGGDEPSANPRGYAFSRRIRIRAALRPALTWSVLPAAGDLVLRRCHPFPIDVHEMCIDVLATDGHKWLLAPAGAGFLYVRSEVQSEIRPLSIGWRNVRNKPVASMDAVALVGGAERYEAGSLNVAALIGLDAAVKLLWSVGIDRIKARVDTLTTRLCEALTSSGYVVVSPRQPGEGSGIVSFLSRTATSREVAKALRSRSIKVSVRDELVRVSPHFYHSDEQIGQLVAELPR